MGRSGNRKRRRERSTREERYNLVYKSVEIVRMPVRGVRRLWFGPICVWYDIVLFPSQIERFLISCSAGRHYRGLPSV